MNIQIIVNAIALGGVYATIAVGYALIFNILKFSNFSHGGVLVATAYMGYFVATKLHTNFIVTLLITALLGGILAMIIEVVAFRRLRKRRANTMLYFVSSMIISILLTNLITVFFSTSYYSYPVFFEKSSFQIGGITLITADWLQLLISVVALFILQFILKKTRLGIAIRALSTDSETTSLMGANVTVIIAATFFVSGALGGVSGMFLGMNYTLYPQLGSTMITKGFVSSIIGGLGNITGAVLGAFILAAVEVALTNIDFIGSSLTPIFTFMLMIIFLLVRPQGIAGSTAKEKV